MRRGTFVTVVALGVIVPIVGFSFAATQTGFRAAVRAFVSPLPSATPAPRPSTVSGLPPQFAITGAESAELRSLGSGDAGAPTKRAARTALFSLDDASPATPYLPPQGLHRPEIASRDDVSIGRAIQHLTNDERGHGALLAALKRSGRYRDQIDAILRAWRIPPELVAIAIVESAFTPSATAFDGGGGLWSLPRETARTYGLAMLPSYDERRAVALSTEAAAHLLADLHERLGSWELAILAFGEGYAVVVDQIGKHATTDYWDLASDLPPDDARYVPEVLAVATMVGNPDRFGLDGVKPDEPIVTSDLEVPAGAGLATVARAAGTSVEKLRELNPEYLGDSVPDTGFVMTMHLPSAGLARAKELLMPLMYSTSPSRFARQNDPRFDWGHGGAAEGDAAVGAAQKDAATPQPASAGNEKRRFYRVQDGDTLDALARHFGVQRETLASDNALDPSAGLHAGQLLLLRPALSHASPE